VPIPAALELDPAKVRLGERLFRDPRLSHGDHVACSSCHQLDRGGDDGLAHSVRADGRPLDFNTPTVFNAGLSFRFDWRGNFRTLEEEAEAVLLDPRRMATNWQELISKLGADPAYREAAAVLWTRCASALVTWASCWTSTWSGTPSGPGPSSTLARTTVWRDRSCGVDEDVHAAQTAQDFPDHLFDPLGHADVSLDEQFHDLTFRQRGARGGRDRRAAGSEAPHDRLAHALGPASDEGALAGEFGRIERKLPRPDHGRISRRAIFSPARVKV
jgi:hypothetical protein